MIEANIDLKADEMTVTDCGDRVVRQLFRMPSGHRSVSLIHCAPEYFSIPEDLKASLPAGCMPHLVQDRRGAGSEGREQP
eukprot:1798246-Pyramimonas_sp.AAC.1